MPKKDEKGAPNEKNKKIIGKTLLWALLLLAAQRQAQVLQKMVRYGYLNEEEADEIANQKEA